MGFQFNSIVRAFPSALLCLVLCQSGTALAHDRGVKVDQDLGVVFDDVDLFQSGVMRQGRLNNPFNRNVGQQLDLSERRPVVDLKGTAFETHYGARRGYHLIANYYHDGKFWVARIPQAGIKNSYFMLSYFSPVAAHSTIRFQMQNNMPLELIAEVPAQADYQRGKFKKKLASPVLVHDIVFSAEAQWTKDDRKKSYSLVRGGLGEFVQIIRFVSMHERFRQLFRNGNQTKMWKLDHSAQEANRALALAIQKSQTDGTEMFYNTLYYNCTNTALDVLIRAQDRPETFGEALRRKLASFAKVSSVIPILTGSYGLTIRGVSSAQPVIMHEDPTLQRVAQESWLLFLAESERASKR